MMDVYQKCVFWSLDKGWLRQSHVNTTKTQNKQEKFDFMLYSCYKK